MKKTLIRDMPDRSRIVAHVEIREDHPRGLSDGFSVIGEVYEPQHESSREWDVGGTTHSEVLRAFPELKPLVDIHLSDLDGTPMHAEANGWYAYSGAMREHEEQHSYSRPPQSFVGLSDKERAAHYLRVPADEIPDGLDREGFSAYVESLRERWASEARAARELFESLP